MEQIRDVADKVNRIKGLLGQAPGSKLDKQQANHYPDPAMLIPAQAAEINQAYEDAIEVPLSFRLRPHRVLALLLYRLGFNPGYLHNAVPLAEWILTAYRRAHPHGVRTEQCSGSRIQV